MYCILMLFKCLLCCQTPGLVLSLRVDFGLSLSQEEEEEQQQQEKKGRITHTWLLAEGVTLHV